MGIDVDLILKIAGVGIVIAFLHTVLDQMGRKEYAMGDAARLYLYFVYGRFDCKRFVSKN
ncbi:Stage III sporulation protein AC/AD protein family protein [Geobacillus sp. BCO2]|nr:Stage III sporulation protein AC/AD protein family protein [Geobacillus sp. BCO2]